MLYGLYEVLRQQLYIVTDAGQMLDGIQYQRGARAKQRRGFGCDYSAVGQFYRRAWHTGLFRACTCSGYSLAVAEVYAGLIEKERNLIYLGVIALAQGHAVERSKVTADNLVARSITAYIIVADAESYHIDPHVSR